jgi:hypothetical protein
MQRLPFSALVESLAASQPETGKSDDARDLAHHVAAWLHDHRNRIVLEAVASAGLEAVTVTLQMKQRVSLLVAGERHGFPGTWTWKVDEAVLPFVWLLVRDEDQPGPYVFCTLDYAVAGRSVALRSGETGTAQFSALIGGRGDVRVQLADGRTVTAAVEDVNWL